MASKTHVQTTINGESTDFLCEPRQSLLECLRDVVGLTGSKEGCNDGNCGACTVVFDGKIVTSCLVLGVEAEGKEVTTIEGVASGSELHPVQQAVVDEQGFQCAFCMPGFVMNMVAMVDENPNPTRTEAAQYLSGNLCRCADYNKILNVALRAAEYTRRG